MWSWWLVDVMDQQRVGWRLGHLHSLVLDLINETLCNSGSVLMLVLQRIQSVCFSIQYFPSQFLQRIHHLTRTFIQLTLANIPRHVYYCCIKEKSELVMHFGDTFANNFTPHTFGYHPRPWQCFRDGLFSAKKTQCEFWKATSTSLAYTYIDLCYGLLGTDADHAVQSITISIFVRWFFSVICVFLQAWRCLFLCVRQARTLHFGYSVIVHPTYVFLYQFSTYWLHS
jgi:hypothetical protein